ncbi:MAG: PaaI family thioesterase [Actinomycetia bacterium]|nr:PaaI family thioesterase [Actinomycetes bacterium]
MSTGTAAPTPTPGFDVTSLESSGAFLKGAGLVLDEVSASKVTGHIDLGAAFHTPWGIVHGGVYSTAIESTASIGASAAVMAQGQVAVGLTNTTHFLRSLTEGRVDVSAVALYQGRTHQLWRADITDESGGLVAHGEVRLQNIPAKTH